MAISGDFCGRQWGDSHGHRDAMPLNAAFVMPACLSWATKRVQDPPRGEQIIERPHRPDLRRSGRGAQIGPRRRDHQVAAVRQHHDQLTLGRPD